MPYEVEKDVLVKDLGAVPNTELHAEIRCYDGGEQKLSIYRLVGKNKKRVQVFRLPFKEITELGEFMVDFTASHGTGEDESAGAADEDES